MNTCCKIYSTEHVDAPHRAQTAPARLNLVSITILEKLTNLMSTNAMWLCTMQSTYTIDEHRWLRLMPAADAPIDVGSGCCHRCQIMSWSSTTQTIPTMPSVAIYGWEEWMVWGVWVQFGSGDMEDGISFRCFFFLSSLLLFWGSRPGTHAISVGFYHLPLEVEFPMCRIHRKVAIELYQLVAGLLSFTSTYTAWLYIASFPFHFFSLVQFIQPRRSAPEEGDNVMVACDLELGNGHSVKWAHYKS